MSETRTAPAASGATLAAPPPAGHLLALRSMLRWNVAQIGPVLPLIVVVQALLAAGIVVGFGLIIPDINPGTALFLSTGTPTVLLMVLGLVIVPQGISRARTDGTFDFQRTLPVPRALQLVADLLVWLLVGLPSVAVAVLVAQLRFDPGLSVDWVVLVPAVLLVTLTASAVGYAVAVILPPQVAQLLTQVLVFFVMLFSPVTFAESQLPGWFQEVHDWLPVRPAADLVRAGLASEAYTATVRDVVVLLVWGVVGIALCLRALSRRG